MKNRGQRKSTAKAVAIPAARLWAVIFAFLILALLALMASKAQAATTEESLHTLEERVWLSDENEFHELERQITRMIQLKPRSAQAHYLMGHLYVRMFSADPGDMKTLRRASELGQQAIDMEPDKDYGYVVVAEILDLMGQSASGVKIIDTRINKKLEESWRTYFMRARLQADTMRAAETLNLLEKALKEKGAQREVITPYVVALLKSEYEGSELVNELESWHKRYPNPLFLQTQAMTLAEMGQTRRAHNLYKMIYQKHPSYKEALINDAILLAEKMNEKGQARDLLLKVLRDHKGKMESTTETVVHLQLASLYLDSVDHRKAEEHFTIAVKMNRDELDLLDGITEAYKKRQKSKELTVLLGRLNREVPGVAVLHALLGEILSEDLKDHKTAVDAFSNAIALEPERSEFYNGLGLTYYRMEEISKALTYFTAATKVDPDDATARYNEACAFALLGRPEEAIGSLKEALALNPQLQQTAKTDKDFDSIRKTQQFESLVRPIPVARKDELR